jgi:hypothetical protein
MLDDQVRRAMQKWPQVPAVYGWLRLSRRGQWFLIDRSVPGFSEARDGDGSLITSPPIIDFIGRNYECDDRGAWYWQNGPQRAFVRIGLAPLILRVLNEPPRQRLITHTGLLVESVSRVLSDAPGNLLLQTDLGPAAIDDRDIGQLQLSSGADGETLLLMEHYRAGPQTDGAWRLEVTTLSGAAALGAEMGFVAEPVTPATGPAAPAAPGA